MQSAGAAYVFVRSGTSWTQQAYVKAPNTTANVQFGYSVALSADGNTLAVSSVRRGRRVARRRERAERAVPRRRNGTGAIYVYTRSGTTWALQAYLKASNAEGGDSLGVIVSISDDGNTVAGRHPRRRLHVDRRQSRRTRATATRRTTRRLAQPWSSFARRTQWAQQAFIKASNTGKEDWFGSRLQISGDGNTPGGRGAARGQQRRRDQRQAG